MTYYLLVETFYRELNLNTSFSFMDFIFIEVIVLLDRLMKNIRAWNTRDSEVSSNTYSICMSTKQRRREKECVQDIAHIKMEMDLLTKHQLSSNMDKVKAIGSPSRAVNSDLEKRTNLLNN